MRRYARLQPHSVVLGMALLGVQPLYADAVAPAGDVAGAARAFEEGQRAQLRHDYDQAAELFELADRMAPSAAMIRKLKSGAYPLYSRKTDPKTGKRRNLGTFSSRQAAEKHERAVQYFKRAG